MSPWRLRRLSTGLSAGTGWRSRRLSKGTTRYLEVSLSHSSLLCSDNYLL
jgi:hypothetical protein